VSGAINYLNHSRARYTKINVRKTAAAVVGGASAIIRPLALSLAHRNGFVGKIALVGAIFACAPIGVNGTINSNLTRAIWTPESAR